MEDINSNSYTNIKYNVSYYKNQKIKDSQIMRHLGIDTYSTLQRLEPELYSKFIECKKDENIINGRFYTYVRPKQFQINFLNSRLSPLEIKMYIIADILNDDIEIPEIIKKLKNSSKSPHKKLEIPIEETISTIIFYLIMISLIAISIYFLYLYHTEKNILSLRT